MENNVAIVPTRNKKRIISSKSTHVIRSKNLQIKKLKKPIPRKFNELIAIIARINL